MELTSSPADDSQTAARSRPAAVAPPKLPRTRARPRLRPWLSDRMTPPTLFGLMAALAVFALVVVLLHDRREMVMVAVTTERVPAGARITQAMVQPAEVPASVSFVDGLVRVEELGDAATAARTLQPGEVVSRSAVGARRESSGSRVMAIPVESWQAVGGELDVGDQVDVIATGEGGPRFVLSGAAVVGRAEGGGGGLMASSSSDLWISVEVNAAQALELAAAVETGDFVVIRSTGATDVAPPSPAAPPATTVPTMGGG